MMARDAKRKELADNSSRGIRHKTSAKGRMINTLSWCFLFSSGIFGGWPGAFDVSLKLFRKLAHIMAATDHLSPILRSKSFRERGGGFSHFVEMIRKKFPLFGGTAS